jgi:hypothetical protein
MDRRVVGNSFLPHAYILTERGVPEPIFVVAVLGANRLLRIDLDLQSHRATFVRQVLSSIPSKLNLMGEISAFGKVTGFWINYAENRAVPFCCYLVKSRS